MHNIGYCGSAACDNNYYLWSRNDISDNVLKSLNSKSMISVLH